MLLCSMRNWLLLKGPHDPEYQYKDIQLLVSGNELLKLH
jgi:hypothetical protein